MGRCHASLLCTILVVLISLDVFGLTALAAVWFTCKHAMNLMEIDIMRPPKLYRYPERKWLDVGFRMIAYRFREQVWVG